MPQIKTLLKFHRTNHVRKLYFMYIHRYIYDQLLHTIKKTIKILQIINPIKNESQNVERQTTPASEFSRHSGIGKTTSMY
jgi:histone deacetylase complex regulatory component SIN3